MSEVLNSSCLLDILSILNSELFIVFHHLLPLSLWCSLSLSRCACSRLRLVIPWFRTLFASSPVPRCLRPFGRQHHGASRGSSSGKICSDSDGRPVALEVLDVEFLWLGDLMWPVLMSCYMLLPKFSQFRAGILQGGTHVAPRRSKTGWFSDLSFGHCTVW